MTGKLKTKGNIMLATKLDGILKVRVPCTMVLPKIYSYVWSIGYKSKTMISRERVCIH